MAGAIAATALLAPRGAAAAEPEAASPPASALTEDQALRRAAATGQQVPIPVDTSATDTETANPDGTLTLTRTAAPVRKMVGGAWKGLDATLVRQTDGTIRPAETTSGLALSGGGQGALATLDDGGRTLAVSAPMALPTPSLSGSTATYPDVLPGVDLQVRADIQGGVTQLFVIKNASAAANPALRTLTMGLGTAGVTVAADAGGNLSADDSHGNPVFTAAAPLMWDSASPMTAPLIARNGVRKADTDPAGTEHTAAVGVGLTSSSIELTPDQTLLDSPGTVYPVYVDPGWSPVGAKKNAWATVAKDFPTTKYYNKTTDPNGWMQSGYSGSITARTLVNIPLPASTLSGATIHTAEFDILNNYSYSCTASEVDLYAPTSTLSSSNADWDDWVDSMGSKVASATVAYGYSGCAAKAVGFDVTSTISADARAGKTSRTFGIRAASESSTGGWKKFDPSTPSLSITYNHKPNTPTGLTTSPSTSCAAATATVVGDGNVTLYAPVSDRDGGSLGVAYSLFKSSDLTTAVATTDPTKLTYPSGSTAVLVVPKATLEKAAAGVVTTFTWKVQVTDTIASSDVSSPCRFSFDPTRPGPPQVDPPTGAQVGQALSLVINPPGNSTKPTGYLYQLNGTAPKTVAAAADGTASISVTPTRFTDALNVIGTSAGGNIGDIANIVFDALPPAVASDQDFTGDGLADLLTVGGAGSVPAGLWLAPGKGNGQVTGTTSDLGAYGDEIGSTGPGSFTGAQVVAGAFTGSGFQDVLAYYPTGDNAGKAAILSGNGDGSPIQSQQSGVETILSPLTFQDENDDNPQQVVDAGNSSDGGQLLPDLIGITGDATTGYALAYYPANGAVGGFSEAGLTTVTPTGGSDWNTWTLASAQVGGKTSVLLWQRSTGALYRWTDLAYVLGTDTIAFTQTSLGTWNSGASVSLQAADIDGNGTADLWATTPAGATTAWLDNGTTLVAATGQTLVPPAHTWLLNDGQTGIATSAADVVAGNTAHATTGEASWNTGSLYDPDVTFDANRSGMNASPIVVGNTDFTVSLWARPTAYSGNIVSQDGNTGAYFKIWPSTDTTWHFGMQKTDGTFSDDAWDEAKSAPNTDALGFWYHITATYQASTKKMSIYIGTTLAGTTTRTGNWPPPAESSTVKLQFGSMKVNSGWGYYYQGELADVQTWNAVVPPTLN